MSFEVSAESDVTSAAVFGSCVTRDIFNRTFNPHYRDLFESVAMCNHGSARDLVDGLGGNFGDRLSGLVYCLKLDRG